MSTQNWNGGNRLTISEGNPAQANGTIANEINVAFLYNSTQAAQNVPVTLVGGNQFPPVTVNIPETTGNAGSAALLSFSGPSKGGSASLTASVNSAGVQADVWLGSQSMPTNTTGLNNQSLQADGNQHSFSKYTRYYFVPSAKYYNLTVTSGSTAFYFVLFTPQGTAKVYVLNAPQEYTPTVANFVGDTYAATNTSITVVPGSTVTISLFGNNQQWVAMNADSVADSNNVTISLTPLS